METASDASEAKRWVTEDDAMPFARSTRMERADAPTRRRARRALTARGYVIDRHAEAFANDEKKPPIKTSPLVNRGYWARVEAIRAATRTFALALASTKTKRANVINLGAGYDTIAFYVRDIFDVAFDVDVDVKVVECDRGKIARAKAGMARASVGIRRALGGAKNFGDERESAGESDSRLETYAYAVGEGYALVACDVRDVADVERAMTAAKVDFSRPTLVLAECVLAYLPQGKSFDLVRWFGERVKVGAFVSYDPIEPDDAFGRTMMRNVESRGCAFRGIYDAPNVAAAARRFTSNAWERAEAYDMNQMYEEKLDARERERIERIERFDEFEEWRLIMAHYCVSYAANGLDSSSFPFPK